MDGRVYLEHARALFATIKRRGDRALAQVAEGQFFAQVNAESNSLAVLVKHVAGNALSRWTDFLTTDGEKPDRRRDEEFCVRPEDTRERLLERWEAGWATLFRALDALSPEHVARAGWTSLSVPRGASEAYNAVPARHRLVPPPTAP